MRFESESIVSSTYQTVINLLKSCYKVLMRIASPFLDARARYYLAKNAKLPLPYYGDRIRAAYLVFEPETWDKQEPVYREMLRRDDVEVDVLVVPSFNGGFSVGKKYGRELEFFQNECESVIPVYDTCGKLLDIKKANYDFVFYEDPYNRHMPWSLRSHQVVRYSKICYIPYGLSGSSVFDSIADNREFFRNVAYTFCDIPEKRETFIRAFQRTCDKGLQHFEYMGYPALEKYYSSRFCGNDQLRKRLTWTPRWSYDKKIGGSHFIEYKDEFLKYAKSRTDCSFTLRPHPMMFTEFVSKGIMAECDVSKYKAELDRLGVTLSQNEPITDVLLDTDILLTDYSSIIVMYFLTGRPVIYCSSAIPFNDAYEAMKPGMYIANNWDDVERYLDGIMSGNDYLEETRRAIIENYFGDVSGSAKSIVDYLIDK